MDRLIVHLNEEYPGWLDWEPETMRLVLSDKVEDEAGFNTLFALQTALNTQVDEEGFHFDNWRLFEKMVLAINGHVPDFAEVEKATPEEIALAVYNLSKIHPVSFGESVAKYIASSFQSDNLVYCPFWESVDKHIQHIPIRSDVMIAWKRRNHNIRAAHSELVGHQLERLAVIESLLQGSGLV